MVIIILGVPSRRTIVFWGLYRFGLGFRVVGSILGSRSFGKLSCRESSGTKALSCN